MRKCAAMELGNVFERLTKHLDRAAGSIEQRLLHALRTLGWLVAALACWLLALIFGLSALIVSLWGTQHVLPLLVPTGVCVALALLFGFMTARSLRNRRQRRALAGTPDAVAPADDPSGSAQRSGHPLAWLMALAGLLYLGPSREFAALALRLRGVLALVAHAMHLARLFARKRSGGAGAL
jgi:hypothetical protein